MVGTKDMKRLHWVCVRRETVSWCGRWWRAGERRTCLREWWSGEDAVGVVRVVERIVAW